MQEWYKKLAALPVLRTKRGRLSLDLVIALGLFVLGVGAGAVDVTHRATGSYYQKLFAPAVMLACGRGYVQPASTVPALSQFLAGMRSSLSCSAIPANIPTIDPNAFQIVHRYLLSSVAFWWSALGVTWPRLTPLFAILYGASIAIAFGIFRLGMSRILAIIGSLVWLFSLTHLAMLPQLRDYAKAPFILAGFLIMGYLVSRPVKRSALLGWSTACGLILGIGVGFRIDGLIVVPAFVLVALLGLPSTGKMIENVGSRLLSVVIFLIAFAATSWPIFSGPASGDGGSNVFHVFLLGFTRPFGVYMGVTNAIYEWTYKYKDRHILSLLTAYSYCTTGRTTPFVLNTQVYEQTGTTYFLAIVRHFPADMLTRLYASVQSILALPFMELGLGRFAFLGIICCVISLLLLSRHSIRLSIFLLFVVLYFCGYSMLQFHPRHYFHLEVIALWCIGFVVQYAIRGVRKLRDGSGTKLSPALVMQPEYWKTPATKRMLGFALGAALVLLVPLYGLRWYQQRHVGAMLEQYTVADLEPLKVTNAPAAKNNVLLQVAQFPQFVAQADNPKLSAIHIEYLVVDIDSKIPSTSFTLRYTPKRPNDVDDQTGSFAIPKATTSGNAQGTTRIYWPVFAGPQIKFAGLEIPKKYLSAVKGVYRVKDSCQFPLPLWVTLPPNWQDANHYQTLSDTGSRPPLPGGDIVSWISRLTE
jgi:hypothetical protein